MGKKFKFHAPGTFERVGGYDLAADAMPERAPGCCWSALWRAGQDEDFRGVRASRTPERDCEVLPTAWLLQERLRLASQRKSSPKQQRLRTDVYYRKLFVRARSST